MDRHAIYAALAAELNCWRNVPYETLTRHIEAEPTVRTVEVAGEPISVEVRVRWRDAKGGPINIEATGNGPNWWMLERMEESVMVSSS